jgi:hypothetical protein
MPSPEQKIDDALRELPPLDRAAALVASLIQDEPCVPAAVLTLISVAHEWQVSCRHRNERG